jgi:succinate-semialdehyde dehydrogenase/glutarate-semialdehyde dehydrogenase
LKDNSLFIQKGFIGGQWVDAKNGKTFPVYEPASAEVLGYVADLGRDDFVRAIEIAHKGYRKYSTTTTFAERGAQLRRWFDLVHENIDDCSTSFTGMRSADEMISGENSEFGKRQDAC